MGDPIRSLRDSLPGLETHVEIATWLTYVTGDVVRPVMDLLDVTRRMMAGLIRSSNLVNLPLNPES